MEKNNNKQEIRDYEKPAKTSNNSVEPLPESTRPRRDGPGGD